LLFNKSSGDNFRSEFARWPGLRFRFARETGLVAGIGSLQSIALPIETSCVAFGFSYVSLTTITGGRIESAEGDFLRRGKVHLPNWLPIGARRRSGGRSVGPVIDPGAGRCQFLSYFDHSFCSGFFRRQAFPFFGYIGLLCVFESFPEVLNVSFQIPDLAAGFHRWNHPFF
jgi:hypothetical protein